MEGHLRQPDRQWGILPGQQSCMEVLTTQEPWSGVSVYEGKDTQVLVPKLPESGTVCSVPGQRVLCQAGLGHAVHREPTPLPWEPHGLCAEAGNLYRG